MCADPVRDSVASMLRLRILKFQVGQLREVCSDLKGTRSASDSAYLDTIWCEVVVKLALTSSSSVPE